MVRVGTPCFLLANDTSLCSNGMSKRRGMGFAGGGGVGGGGEGGRGGGASGLQNGKR